MRETGSSKTALSSIEMIRLHLSEAFTLEPGDVIATGTPAGVGVAREPFPEGLLKVGDVVRIEIEGIGELENTVVDEPDGYLVPEAEESLAWLR